eukprot:scaffold3058_cov110-Cylindrotheca_fusiformis.AAC.4
MDRRPRKQRAGRKTTCHGSASASTRRVPNLSFAASFRTMHPLAVQCTLLQTINAVWVGCVSFPTRVVLTHCYRKCGVRTLNFKEIAPVWQALGMHSMPSPSCHRTVTELSRTSKYTDYCNPVRRKRKRHTNDLLSHENSKNSNSTCCFQVKTGHHGIGIFATQPIACGDFIIAHEEPMVCATPMGSLKGHHLKAPFDMALPGMEAHDNGIVYTKDHKTCPQCQTAAWCSDTCWEKGRHRHSYLRNATTTSLHHFFQNQENPIIFQLAVQVITLALCKFEQSKSRNTSTRTYPIEEYLWWEDYGSHPLWWTIGDSDDWPRRKTQTEQLRHELTRILPPTGISKKLLCTVDHLGSILGMLQSNVMEFSFQAPLQQYMEQVEDCVTTEHNNEGNEKEFSLGLTWIKQNISMPSGNESSGSNTLRHSNPVVGSGLYPLLTLANHDCNPNASIEFLQETNCGSMVALRDIPMGEEICITYVPNGDHVDKDGDFFRHFEATRTWKWLNAVMCDEEDDDCSREDDIASQAGDSLEESESHSKQDIDDDEVEEGAVSDDEEEEPIEPLEGTQCEGRRVALLEYGFLCQCSRCLLETK